MKFVWSTFSDLWINTAHVMTVEPIHNSSGDEVYAVVMVNGTRYEVSKEEAHALVGHTW